MSSTYKDLLLKECPHYVGADYIGGCFGCPDWHGYEKYSVCNGVDELNCTKCWNRTVEEEKYEEDLQNVPI